MGYWDFFQLERVMRSSLVFLDVYHQLKQSLQTPYTPGHVVGAHINLV